MLNFTIVFFSLIQFKKDLKLVEEDLFLQLIHVVSSHDFFYLKFFNTVLDGANFISSQQSACQKKFLNSNFRRSPL